MARQKINEKNMDMFKQQNGKAKNKRENYGYVEQLSSECKKLTAAEGREKMQCVLEYGWMQMNDI